MIYTFFRENGFYPLEFSLDAIAMANAACNPGTIRVVNEATRVTIYKHTEHWLEGLTQAIRILEQSKFGADAAGEEFSRDEITACLANLQGIQRRKQ